MLIENRPLGKAVLNSSIEYNALSDIYFPHDESLQSAILKSPVEAKYGENSILISNSFNDGLSGHFVSFELSEQLDILRINYDEWEDVIDGSSTTYEVEKVIIVVDRNPFSTEGIIGFYTLQIKRTYNAGDILAKEGVKDTINYKVFHGKFKIEGP